MDSTSILVASTDGFCKGARIKIEAGQGAGEILVIKDIVSPQTMVVRKYNIFDKAHDLILSSWYRLQDKLLTWYESKFGSTETPEDYDESLD
jgi:hypothetical protein